MAQWVNSINELLASIDLTNNGYLFAPSERELEIARLHPEEVRISNGRIYRVGTPTEYFPTSPSAKRATFTVGLVMEPDYEELILARQEADMSNW